MFLYILFRQVIYLSSHLFPKLRTEGFLQFLMGHCFELSFQIFSQHIDIANATKVLLISTAAIWVSLLVESGKKLYYQRVGRTYGPWALLCFRPEGYVEFLKILGCLYVFCLSQIRGLYHRNYKILELFHGSKVQECSQVSKINQNKDLENPVNVFNYFSLSSFFCSVCILFLISSTYFCTSFIYFFLFLQTGLCNTSYLFYMFSLRFSKIH